MEKQFLFDAVEENAAAITTLSDTIWDYAELSMEEYRSAEYYCGLLEREGFQVEIGRASCRERV